MSTTNKRSPETSQDHPEQLSSSRKQQRVLKNRQSAQASRERHRQHVQELEASREALLIESTNLHLRVAQLELDKARLAVEVETLRNEFLQLRKAMLGESVVMQTGPVKNMDLLSPANSAVKMISIGGDRATDPAINSGLPGEHSPSTRSITEPGHFLVPAPGLPLTLSWRSPSITLPHRHTKNPLKRRKRICSAKTCLLKTRGAGPIHMMRSQAYSKKSHGRVAMTMGLKKRRWHRQISILVASLIGRFGFSLPK